MKRRNRCASRVRHHASKLAEGRHGRYWCGSAARRAAVGIRRPGIGNRTPTDYGWFGVFPRIAAPVSGHVACVAIAAAYLKSGVVETMMDTAIVGARGPIAMHSPGSVEPPAGGAGRRLRILFVNDHLGNANGVAHGGTAYLERVLGGLVRQGVDARLAILRPEHPARERLERVGVSPEFLGRSKWDPRAFNDLRALVRRLTPDVVHLNGMKAHLLGRLAASEVGCPAIVHLHFEYAPWPSFAQPWLAARTARLLAVSSRLAEHGVRAYRVPRERVEVLHNGVDLAPFARAAEEREATRARLGLAPETPVAIVVGRITFTPDKGHREAIAAMAQFRRARPDARLLVVGDGPDRGTCEALAESRGLSGAITFLGQRSDVPQLLAASDVAVVPSMCEEAFSFAALEASASGRPVIAFDVGGMSERVRPGVSGLLVPRGDVEGLADAMGTLLGDVSLRTRMGAEARVDSSAYALDRHVARLIAIYGELRAARG